MNKIISGGAADQPVSRTFTNWVLAGYALIAMLDLVGLSLASEGIVLHRVAKSLLMPGLMLLVWSAGPGIPRRGWLFAALFASWLGDLLLMLPGNQFFLFGLASFFVAHVFYLLVFQVGMLLRPGGLLRIRPWMALPFLGFAGALLGLLWEGIPADMRLSVCAYAGVISLMALAAWGKSRAFSAPWAGLLMAGALLFLLSDSLIALGKFGQEQLPIPAQPVWVMFTYALAQGCIVWSWVQGASKIE